MQKFMCMHCCASVSATPDQAGQALLCPECGHRVKVPHFGRTALSEEAVDGLLERTVSSESLTASLPPAMAREPVPPNTINSIPVTPVSPPVVQAPPAYVAPAPRPVVPPPSAIAPPIPPPSAIAPPIPPPAMVPPMARPNGVVPPMARPAVVVAPIARPIAPPAPPPPVPSAFLEVDPAEFMLWKSKVGENQKLSIVLTNRARRPLAVTASSSSSWLVFGPPPGVSRLDVVIKLRQTLPAWVKGTLLRTGDPLKGQVEIRWDGGRTVVPVELEVPVIPFPQGVLAGAESPRALAKKARGAPAAAKEALASGAVAAWYRRNGWIYPKEDPTIADPLRRFFRALGLPEA